jgi:hypothetical protein
VDNWYREDTRLTNNYNSLYGQEWDKYSLGYNTAWDEYLNDRSEKFTTEQNEQNWERQDKANAKSDLINLITGTGYKPTDSELKSAGMTREQASSYAKAYSDGKASTGGSTGGNTGGTKYADFGYDEQQKWGKEFMKAESLSDVEWIADRMSAAGVDPQIVASWYDNYAKKFKVGSPAPVTPTATGGGGGGGTWYLTTR